MGQIRGSARKKLKRNLRADETATKAKAAGMTPVKYIQMQQRQLDALASMPTTRQVLMDASPRNPRRF